MATQRRNGRGFPPVSYTHLDVYKRQALEELSSQFNSLLAEASANPAEDYTERFQELSESTTRLKERKAQMEGAYQEQGRLQNRLRAVSAAMEHMTAAMTEWDEEVIHQLLEKVTVLSREKIRVTFRDGRKIEQYVACLLYTSRCV